MSKQLDDETLQRFYDGDLSPVEERVVQARIESDPDAQRRLAELKKVSALIREGADEMASRLDSDALFAAIEKDIARHEQAGLGERLRVITGEWMTHRRQVVLVAVAAAAAMAVISLSARHTDDDESARMRLHKEKTRIAEVKRTQVENVDFGKNTGTVFEIENAGVMTAVVWIADEEEEEAQ